MTATFRGESVGSHTTAAASVNSAVVAQDRPRLIVSSYCFPPEATIGARRWEKLSEILAEHGWLIDVVTSAPPGTPESSATRADGVRVHYVAQPRIWRAELENLAFRMFSAVRRGKSASSSSQPVDAGRTRVPEGSQAAGPLEAAPRGFRRGWNLSSVRGWMRMHWVLTEFARAESWGKQAARTVTRLANANRPDFIVSSAPPHPAHFPMARAATRLRIPFVMDMRDPWSLVEALHEHLDTPLWYSLAATAEQSCVTRSALIVANTPRAGKSLAARYPDAAERIISVLNASDDDPLPTVAYARKFVMAFAGTLYTDRGPRALLRAVANLVHERHISPDRLSIRFMGDFGPGASCDMELIAAQEGVADYVEVRCRQSRAVALAFLAEAAVLVTFPTLDASSVPAKVFECIRFPAWVLALDHSGSAVEELLAGTEARVIAPERIDQTAGCLSEWLDRFEGGERPTPAVPDDRFSRARQARVLIDALTRLKAPV